MKSEAENKAIPRYSVKSLCTFIFICVILSIFSPATTHADPQSILFISQENKSFSSALVNSIKHELKKNHEHINIKHQNSNTPLSKESIKHYDLIITLGSRPAEVIIKKHLKTPLLSLLVTNRAFDTLKKIKSKDQPWSALLLNQPIKRQLLLIKHMLGKNKTVGVILGPYSSKHKDTLIKASKTSSLKIQYETIDVSDQLVSSLKHLTRKSDALLAIPDPVTFNKKTIRSILLLSYRKRIPVIGFSKSYVKAGAAASIYSSPEQISKHAVELIVDFFRNKQIFKKTIYHPKYFSIAKNNNVIRALDIRLKNEEELINLIKIDEYKK